ncbi:hypothetical protein KEM52_000434, partial [Ascosphaera acerosa]
MATTLAGLGSTWAACLSTAAVLAPIPALIFSDPTVARWVQGWLHSFAAARPTTDFAMGAPDNDTLEVASPLRWLLDTLRSLIPTILGFPLALPAEWLATLASLLALMRTPVLGQLVLLAVIAIVRRLVQCLIYLEMLLSRVISSACASVLQWLAIRLRKPVRNATSRVSQHCRQWHSDFKYVCHRLSNAASKFFDVRDVTISFGTGCPAKPAWLPSLVDELSSLAASVTLLEQQSRAQNECVTALSELVKYQQHQGHSDHETIKTAIETALASVPRSTEDDQDAARAHHPDTAMLLHMAQQQINDLIVAMSRFQGQDDTLTDMRETLAAVGAELGTVTRTCYRHEALLEAAVDDVSHHSAQLNTVSTSLNQHGVELKHLVYASQRQEELLGTIADFLYRQGAELQHVTTDVQSLEAKVEDHAQSTTSRLDEFSWHGHQLMCLMQADERLESLLTKVAADLDRQDQALQDVTGNMRSLVEEAEDRGESATDHLETVLHTLYELGLELRNSTQANQTNNDLLTKVTDELDSQSGMLMHITGSIVTLRAKADEVAETVRQQGASLRQVAANAETQSALVARAVEPLQSLQEQTISDIGHMLGYHEEFYTGLAETITRQDMDLREARNASFDALDLMAECIFTFNDFQDRVFTTLGRIDHAATQALGATDALCHKPDPQTLPTSITDGTLDQLLREIRSHLQSETPRTAHTGREYFNRSLQEGEEMQSRFPHGSQDNSSSDGSYHGENAMVLYNAAKCQRTAPDFAGLAPDSSPQDHLPGVTHDGPSLDRTAHSELLASSEPASQARPSKHNPAYARVLGDSPSKHGASTQSRADHVPRDETSAPMSQRRTNKTAKASKPNDCRTREGPQKKLRASAASRRGPTSQRNHSEQISGKTGSAANKSDNWRRKNTLQSEATHTAQAPVGAGIEKAAPDLQLVTRLERLEIQLQHAVSAIVGLLRGQHPNETTRSHAIPNAQGIWQQGEAGALGPAPGHLEAPCVPPFPGQHWGSSHPNHVPDFNAAYFTAHNPWSCPTDQPPHPGFPSGGSECQPMPPLHPVAGPTPPEYQPQPGAAHSMQPSADRQEYASDPRMQSLAPPTEQVRRSHDTAPPIRGDHEVNDQEDDIVTWCSRDELMKVRFGPLKAKPSNQDDEDIITWCSRDEAIPRFPESLLKGHAALPDFPLSPTAAHKPPPGSWCGSDFADWVFGGPSSLPDVGSGVHANDVAVEDRPKTAGAAETMGVLPPDFTCISAKASESADGAAPAVGSMAAGNEFSTEILIGEPVAFTSGKTGPPCQGQL